MELQQPNCYSGFNVLVFGADTVNSFCLEVLKILQPLLVVGDQNEAGSLGFWSVPRDHQAPRAPSCHSATVIKRQQYNNLDFHQTANNQTLDLFSWENWFGSRWLFLWHFSIRSRAGLPRKEPSQTCSGPASALGRKRCIPFKFTFENIQITSKLILPNDPRWVLSYVRTLAQKLSSWILIHKMSCLLSFFDLTGSPLLDNIHIKKWWVKSCLFVTV